MINLNFTELIFINVYKQNNNYLHCSLDLAEVVKLKPSLSLGLSNSSRLGGKGQGVQGIEHPGSPQVVPLLVSRGQGHAQGLI
jgi:hypothetical protein